ncbi:MAG: Arc family DNA-binding protein [Spirochaeta sp.]|jgi:plasmid stability protein|nr:Arc family DNA-binding protein [Spirochaeta sp.]
MSQITIRDLPEEVERAIRERARERHTSLNRVVTDLVEEALGFSQNRAKRRDLSELAGTWSATEADSFDTRVESMRTIDPEIWQQ